MTQEIADTLGKPLGTIMNSLFYAKKQLRKILQEYLSSEKPGKGNG